MRGLKFFVEKGEKCLGSISNFADKYPGEVMLSTTALVSYLIMKSPSVGKNDFLYLTLTQGPLLKALIEYANEGVEFDWNPPGISLLP